MKLQIKFQKAICLIVLIVCAVTFVTSLGLNTDFYNVLKPFSKEADDPIVEGANLFYDIQGFNKQLNSMAVVAIILAVTLFVTSSDKRRKYFYSNYIACGATSLFLIGESIWSMSLTSHYKNQFINSVDWEQMQHLIDTREKYKMYEANQSTLFLDLNLIANALAIVVALLLIANVVWKIVETKRENMLLQPITAMEAK